MCRGLRPSIMNRAIRCETSPCPWVSKAWRQGQGQLHSCPIYRPPTPTPLAQAVQKGASPRSSSRSFQGPHVPARCSSERGRGRGRGREVMMWRAPPSPCPSFPQRAQDPGLLCPTDASPAAPAPSAEPLLLHFCTGALGRHRQVADAVWGRGGRDSQGLTGAPTGRGRRNSH